MSVADKLKPCPFCGGEPYMSKADNTDHSVSCFPCGLDMGHHYHETKAVEAWNKRINEVEKL